MEGNIDGFTVTAAEFETTWAGARDPRKWQTLVFWASNGDPEPMAWPGEFARDGAHAAWRIEGALSGELLDRMAAGLPAARKLLG